MFEADDAGSITCPHCHSGNVVEVKQKSHTKTIIIAAVAAVVVVVGVVLAVKLLRSTSAPADPEPDPIEENTETPEGGSSIVETPSAGEEELRKSGDAYADSMAAKERADSIARAEAAAAQAEAERKAEEAARKAREEAAKKPAIERISEAKVQSMMQTYLSNGNIAIFRTQQFADRNPHLRCSNSDIKRVSDLLDYKNIAGDVSVSVTGLEFNDNNQVTYIVLRIN